MTLPALAPEPRLLVGGTPRSGTTLTRNLLDSHPRLSLPDESYFMVQVWRTLGLRRAASDMPEAWRMISGHRSFHNWGLDLAVLADVVDRHAVRSYPELLKALFAAFAEMRGTTWSGDKTTTNARSFDLLSAWFPSATMVHVLRDPREVAMSLVLQHWHRGGLASAADQWRGHVSAARDFARRQPGRFHELRYEDLVADPAAAMRRLCEAASLRFEPEMLDHTRSDNLLRDRHHDRARQPVQPSPRRWQDELSPDDLAVIELVAGRLMDEVGYRRVTGRRRLVAAAELISYKAASRYQAMVSARPNSPRPAPVEAPVEVRPLTADDVFAVAQAASPG